MWNAKYRTCTISLSDLIFLLDQLDLTCILCLFNMLKFTFTICLPPWPHKSDPVSLVCSRSIQPLSESVVLWWMSSVIEDSQRFTTRQTLVTCTEPCPWFMILSVALGVHWQPTTSSTARTCKNRNKTYPSHQDRLENTLLIADVSEQCLACHST